MAKTTEAEAPPATEEKKAKVASGKVVQYVGTADVREIDKAAWDNVGVSDQTKVVWSAKNKFQVAVEDLSDDAVRYLDEDDAGFVLLDLNVDK
jgi:hypothetical protein